jgi:Domain of unknown function (DUF1992)
VSAPRPDHDRPIIRRDADGVERTAPSWETLTERLIREAQEAGAFDELPHRGRPLPAEDDAFAGDMAMAYRVLRNAGAAPPWIEADKEARRIEVEIDRLLASTGGRSSQGGRRARERLVRLVREHGIAVERLAVLAPTPRQHRRRLDLAGFLRRLDDASTDGRRST